MRLMSPGDVARRLLLSVSRIVQLDRQGILPAIRDSAGRRLFDAEAVEQVAREREARRSSVSPDLKRQSDDQ